MHLRSVPRGGKTWLLRHLAQQYTSGANVLCGDRGIVVVSVDGADLARGPDWQATLLQACRMPFLACADAWRLQLGGIADLSELSQAMRSMVAGCAALFLFDTLDALTPPQFAWLDEALLEPLACSHRAVVVLAGRSDVTGWRLETTRRLQVIDLPGLGMDETAELGRKHGFNGAGRELYSYSQGYPYLTQLLAVHPAPLAHTHVCAALQHVEDELLRELPADKRRVIRFLAILRQLERDPLRALLQEMWWDGQTERAEAIWLLQFFQARVSDPDWLFWDRPNRCFRLTLVIRGVLLHQLRLVDPELYTKGHRVAERIYRRWLQQFPYDSGKFLREAIYHQTAVELPAPSRTEDGNGGGALALVHGRLAAGGLSADQAIALERDLGIDQRLPEKQAWIGTYERIRQQLHDFVAGTGPYHARPQEGAQWQR